MKSINQWHEEIFVQSLRELFITSGNFLNSAEASKQLKRITRKHISWHLREDSNDEWREDHTKLNLIENYYSTGSHSDLYRCSVDKLEFAIDKLAQCAIFEELCDVRYFQWKSFSPPIYAYVNCKQIWAAPALIWSDKNAHNVLNLRLAEATDDYPLSLGISAIYLAQRSGVPYSRIQCRKVFIHDTVDIYSGHCSVDDLTLLIETSSSEMLDKISDDNIAVESNFYRCNDTKKCALCNFQEACLDNI